MALRPSDPVYVQRFHREGRVVRVAVAKKLAVVNMGLLEVEVPFDGLAMAPKPKEPRPSKPPRPRPIPKSPEHQPHAAVPPPEPPRTEMRADPPTDHNPASQG